MANLHPHWQEEDAQPVRVNAAPFAPKTAPDPEMNPGMRTVSRRPAAIVGITLVLLTLFAVFRPETGTETKGQAQNDFKIVLTPDGPIPDVITAAPGDQVEFLNLFQDPQSLDVSGIPTLEGTGRTPPIPFQASYITTIDPYALRGEFTYKGVTAPQINGTIIVEFFSEQNIQYPGENEPDPVVEPDPVFEPEPQPEPEPAPEPTFEEQYPYPDNIFPGDNEEPPVVTLPSMEELPGDNEPAVPATPPQDLPTNPFTVQYGQIYGTPLPPPYEGNLLHAEPTHQGAPLMPRAQPSTGAGEWIVILGSIASLLFVTRKAFYRV